MEMRLKLTLTQLFLRGKLASVYILGSLLAMDMVYMMMAACSRRFHGVVLPEVAKGIEIKETLN